MNKLSKEKKQMLILVCLVILFVLGVLYTFVLAKQQDKINGLNNGIGKVTGLLDKANRAIKRASVTETNLAQAKMKLGTMEKMMSPGGDWRWARELINEFETGHGLTALHQELTTAEQFSVGARLVFKDAELMPKFPYLAAKHTLTIKGRYYDIGRYIAGFENIYPYVRLELQRVSPDIGGSRTRRLGGVDSPGLGTINPVVKADVRVVFLLLPDAT